MMSAMHRDVTPADAEPAAETPRRSGADSVLRTLVDVSGDGLAVLDHRGCFVQLNPAGAKILGVTASWLVGRPSPFIVGESATTWTGPSPSPAINAARSCA